MTRCHRCGEAWGEKGSPGTLEDCLRCGSALHACANCRFYDVKSLDFCREPMTRGERPREPETFNICSWFVFRDPGEDGSDDETRSKSARMAIEQLFCAPGASR